MGVPLMRTKTWAYATGAFFGGVAGAYFASFKSSTFPNDFNFNISAFILSMVILGGMGNVWGVMFGAAFLAYLNQEGLANIGHSLNHTFGTHLDVPLYQFGIYGAIIVLTMLIRPEGLIPSARRKAEFHEGVHDTPLYDVGDAMTERQQRNLLVAEQVRKEFGGLVATNDVDFTIPRESVVSLIGPNGAGKTTFFNMLTGVYKPTAGTHRLRRRGRDGPPAARDHRARHRPNVPEHPPVPEHDRARERAGRDALPPQEAASSARSCARRASGARNRTRAGARQRAARVLRPARQGRRDLAQPLVRRPAPAGGCACARDEAEAAAARRADSRHEPAGDRGLHGFRRTDSGTSRS